MNLYDDTKTIRELHRSFYKGVRDDVQSILIDVNQDDNGNPVWATVEQIIANEQERIDERLSEEAESIVTYTADAETIVFVADSAHADAYEDEMGERAPTVEAQAAYAYLAAAREVLSNEYTLRDFQVSIFGEKASA